MRSKFRHLFEGVRRSLAHPFAWFAVLPVFMSAAYWFCLRSLAFTNGGSWRIPALPKVFFDQSMYLQVIAKDLLHGFHILPLPLRPLIVLARLAWPAVSLSEIYAIGVIASAVASLWLFAAAVRAVGEGGAAEARWRSLAAFLAVQSILVLRPGGPSWYVPFFLAALIFVWIGEAAWSSCRPWKAVVSWIAAAVLSSVYPWYFASIAALAGLLFLYRFAKPRFVLPGVGVGLVAAWIAIALRAQIVEVVTHSYAVLLAYYGGVQFSHLTTLSNTILLMAGWIAFWLPPAVRSLRRGAVTPQAPAFFLFAWVGQAILWFQSIATGLSIVPDHFIYSVWIFSALSWAVGRSANDAPSAWERRIKWMIAVIAAVYAGSIVLRIATGAYAWATYPSLLIHLGSWVFLALAAFPVARSRMLAAMLVLGTASSVFGAAAVRSSALARAGIDREVDGVRAWISETRPSTDVRWCSDHLASDYLFSATGQAFYPVFSEKHDPVSITQLQNRLIEESAYFNPQRSGDLFMWDDMILHDLDFPCRVFQPGIRFVDRLPIPDASKHFITGCDQAWVNGERARVIGEMADQWARPVPPLSPLCDRFVVRSRYADFWRIPAGYSELYSDATTRVYGRSGPSSQ